MYLAKEAKIVNGLSPQDVDGDGAIAGDYVSMKGYDHCTVIIHMGVVGAAGAVTLTQATDVSNSQSDAKTLGFSYQYNNIGLTTDTLTETAVTSNTFDHSANAENIYVIEVDARQLDTANGFDCFRVNIAAQAGGSTILSILYILTEARYGNAVSAITD